MPTTTAPDRLVRRSTDTSSPGQSKTLPAASLTGVHERREGRLREGGDRDTIVFTIRAARHVADLTAQMRIDALWRAKGDPDEARWMLDRLAADLRTTRRALIASMDPSWWESAGIDDIAGVYQLAHAWSRDHPDIALMEQRLLATIEARFGVTLTSS